MPGLMGRASTIIKAKFSRLLDHAENPNETLDYSYEAQLTQLQNVKRGIADVATAKKRLELQYTSMQQQAEKLDGQLQGLMDQGQQLEAQQAKLVEGEKALSAKVEAFRTQKEVIKAQYSAAEAQVRIGEAASGIGEHMADVGMAVERAKDKTQQLQARANAIEELTAAGSLDDFTSTGDDIDRELAKVTQSGQVDDELAKLKSEIGQGEAPKELGGTEGGPAQTESQPAGEAE